MGDLGEASEEDAAAVLPWLDGNLSGVSGDTALRFDGPEYFANNLAEHYNGAAGIDCSMPHARSASSSSARRQGSFGAPAIELRVPKISLALRFCALSPRVRLAR